MKLTITNGAITLAGNTILEQVNMDINSGDKIAITGRNGAGKTTLIKGIIDNSLFEEGIGEEKFQISKIGNFDIGYLKQIDFEDENITLLDEVRKSFQELINMENKMNKLVELMNKNNTDKLIKDYTDLQERYKLLGGYSYKKEYEIMLNKFGFTESDKSKKINEFSGGQKTKIAFIKLLLRKPDLLILDEPTNHLDITTIEWLEEYLKNYKKTLILISHDRMFLNNIVNVIYDIEYGTTVRYKGNYSYYEKEKQLRYEKAVKDYEFQQKEIARLKAIYERFRYKPSKASLAMSRLHQLEKMEIIEKPNKIDTNTFKTNLSEIQPSVKNVLKAKDLVIGYDKPLATIDLTITRGKKIGVIGKNGIGKSTLLKTLNGIITPLSGEISYGLHVNPGYFDQTLIVNDSSATVLEDFKASLPELIEPQARSALGSFLFKGDDVHKKINVLSGGEKVRLQLCKILYNKPNFIILDEPTNHMDIIGKEHLEEILSEYEGTIIFVSHDRYFVKKIADQLIVFEDDGVHYYPYGYEEYTNELAEKEKLMEQETPKKNKKEVVEEQPKLNTYNVKKDLNKIENEIIKLEVKISELNQELFNENVYSDFNKSQSIKDKIDSLNKELEEKNDKWLELTEIIMNN